MKTKIHISISAQRLDLFEDNALVKSYPISSAKKGIGAQKNSFQTPLGKHIIRAKIGKDLAENSVLVGRRPTGEIYSDSLANQAPERDWVLTRILWLSGTEQGLNRLGTVDSMQRYIYIHGTPDSEPMGVPASHGCIRMRNQAVMDLFDRVPVGTEVCIDV